MNIYNIDTFPYAELKVLPFGPPIMKGHNAGTRYPAFISAFDIETTRIKEIEQSVMYVWQFAAGIGQRVYVCIGRTWPEYLRFIERLTADLGDGEIIPVYVHNLSFEFQFLRSWQDFNADDAVFITARRKILKARSGHMEYRCSYLHSNMSLDEYTRKMGVDYVKVHGFKYDKERWPWTPLTDFEKSYIVSDVVGLIQALSKEMTLDHDDLYTIPATSTGYVRRDLRDAMKTYSKDALRNMQPSLEVFEMLREAFRGGDTHANRFYSGQVLEHVHSVDRSSSYPDCQVNEVYPMGPWSTPVKPKKISAWLSMVKHQQRAILARVAFWDLKLKNPAWGAPYLSRDKCRKIYVKPPDPGETDRRLYMYDNGRILYADYLETTITDIDLRIIMDEYTFTGMDIIQATSCRLARLPWEWIDCNLKYYRQKTELKGVSGQEVYYMKSKNKLNAIYGDTVQDPAKHRELYKHDEYIEDPTPTAELLAKSGRWPYKNYAWGVWCTAWARWHLHQVIKLAHNSRDPKTGVRFNGFVYCDTDSVKYLGEIPELKNYNFKRQLTSRGNGAFADDPAGVRHYMGVYEEETGPTGYDKFKTLGAKKYVYMEKDKLHATIAGVVKSLAPDEMKHDINNFREGFTFHAAGGLEAVYNDDDYGFYNVVEYVKKGRFHRRRHIHRVIHRLFITRNTTLRPSSYTIGIAGEYARILNDPDIYLDIFDQTYYNEI